MKKLQDFIPGKENMGMGKQKREITEKKQSGRQFTTTATTTTKKKPWSNFSFFSQERRKYFQLHHFFKNKKVGKRSMLFHGDQHKQSDWVSDSIIQQRPHLQHLTLKTY